MQVVDASQNAGQNQRDRELNVILTDLQKLLGQRRYMIPRVNQLILKLAKRLIEIKFCEPQSVSSAIKHLLRGNIVRGEITPRYIHRSLPLQFKRSYLRKREQSSHFILNRRTSNEDNHTITQRDSIFEIQTRLSRGKLQMFLDLMSPYRQEIEKDVCLKLLFDPNSQLLHQAALGDASDLDGISWFPLDKEDWDDFQIAVLDHF
jgi:hypothetical protein